MLNLILSTFVRHSYGLVNCQSDPPFLPYHVGSTATGLVDVRDICFSSDQARLGVVGAITDFFTPGT